MAVISTVGFVIGVLGGGAATYLYVTTPSIDDSRQSALIGLGGKW